MKQLDKTQIAMINAAIFDDCKNLKITDGEPDFSAYRNLKIKGTYKTDWTDYLFTDKINIERHFSFGNLSLRNVRKGLLNAKQLAFWQGYFIAKFGRDFGINNY